MQSLPMGSHRLSVSYLECRLWWDHCRRGTFILKLSEDSPIAQSPVPHNISKPKSDSVKIELRSQPNSNKMILWNFAHGRTDLLSWYMSNIQRSDTRNSPDVQFTYIYFVYCIRYWNTIDANGASMSIYIYIYRKRESELGERAWKERERERDR